VVAASARLLIHMTETLLLNLTPVLAAVGIPFLLMAFFTLIRIQTGNTVSAMPDVYIFLATVNLYFAVWPDSWKPMVYSAVQSSFPALSFFLGAAALVLFASVLPVERRIGWCRIKAILPEPSHSQLPPAIRNQRFPYLRLIGSWILVAAFAAINALEFILR
jgi:hypothetical protein